MGGGWRNQILNEFFCSVNFGRPLYSSYSFHWSIGNNSVEYGIKKTFRNFVFNRQLTRFKKLWTFEIGYFCAHFCRFFARFFVNVIKFVNFVFNSANCSAKGHTKEACWLFRSNHFSLNIGQNLAFFIKTGSNTDWPTFSNLREV